MSVQAMKAGAVEFLTKPFKDDVLLDAIRGAIERSHAALRLDSDLRALRTRYESLTPREREVMALVVSGLLNKQVGGELGISEITVKAHRGQVMRKMAADSLPGLVTMSARLGLRPCESLIIPQLAREVGAVQEAVGEIEGPRRRAAGRSGRR
jgi:FixJ family two-component response regulator